MSAFNNDKYKEIQSQKILERLQSFNGKLYLEFGGKLFDDYHASRVLPGFEPDSKITMLAAIRESVEVVVVLNSNDIVKNRIRNDIGITYDEEAIRLIESFRSIGFYVSSVVITMYHGQLKVQAFSQRLNNVVKIRTYFHYLIEGYPLDLDVVFGDSGFLRNDYIETTKSIVVVTAPGPGSGKMATCLSQIYLDFAHKQILSGYAKFETFPIWNLPVQHPINIAYEAATLDLEDKNMIDPFHLASYHINATNYNRDIDTFPILKMVFDKIYGRSIYNSPTDMGVNMTGYCIEDDDQCRLAASREIVRRYYGVLCDNRRGTVSPSIMERATLLLTKANISVPVVYPLIRFTLAKAQLYNQNQQQNDARSLKSVTSIEISINKLSEKFLKESTRTHPQNYINGGNSFVATGKESLLLTSASAALINALKVLGDIPKTIPLLSQNIIEPIRSMKLRYFKTSSPSLRVNELLIVLAIGANSNPLAELAIRQLPKLKQCCSHSTQIMLQDDEIMYKKLGIYTSTEDIF